MPTSHSAAVETELPKEYLGWQGLLEIRHEEDAICWFWAYPRLFPWSAPIHWLYTPVVGNSRWPGDLWGVDERGELLILECKQCRRRDDPFHDFVAYHRSGREELTADHWLAKWRRHLRAELTFPSSTIERPPQKTAGMLPRSNRRSHIRRWPILAGLIDAHISSGIYFDSVQLALDKRKERSNPTPHYCALMVVSNDSPLLTPEAIGSGHRLVELVGAGQVHVASAQARVENPGRVRLSSAIELMPSDFGSVRLG